MGSFRNGADTEIESELLDLSSVRLSALRQLDGAELLRSLDLVVAQVVHRGVSASTSTEGAVRID
jgi:hypothetical protein